MKQSANKTVYIDNWFTWYGEPNNDGVIATQLPSGKWACELRLPLINQTVKSISSTAANAMENASSKAIPLVEKYLSEHPNVTFLSRTQIQHYEFYTDESGFTGFRVNPEYRRRQGNVMLNKHLKSTKVVEKAIAKIKTIAGNEKGLFIQLIDRALFSDSATIDEIQTIISSHVLDGLSQTMISWAMCTIAGNSVIAIGYTMEMD